MTYVSASIHQRFTPPKEEGIIFCANSTGISDNAALFSNLHKLGIHQAGLLPSNGDSQLLSGLVGVGLLCVKKGQSTRKGHKSIREVRRELTH